MAILAPLLLPAIGIAEGTAAFAIGELALGLGTSLGASYLAAKLSPQPSTKSYPGMRLFVSYDNNGPRYVALGTVADAGEFVYHNEYGPNGNDYVQLVYKLADHPCDSLVGLYVNGVHVTIGSDATNPNVTGKVISEYAGGMWISFHNGAWDQSADSDLVAKATGGEWSSNYRGRGVCYVRVTMKYDANLYKDGRPNFLFVYRGAKLYDWRKDSTAGGSGTQRWGNEATYAWSDNVAVCLYNWKRGIYVNGQKLAGMNVPAASMPADVWTASANACDEAVSLKAGGTEKRYRLNGLIPVDSQNATVVRDMIAAMAGVPAASGGVFKFYAGVSQGAVLDITDADLTSTDDVTFAPRQSRSGLVNAVFGSFNDPAQLYKSSALPPRVSSADAATDGGIELTKSYDLKYVSSGTQGQRILEIFRRRGRFQRNLTLKLGAIGAILESGDWITWTSDRYGFDDATFIVVQATLNRDFTVSVELQETSDTIYNWNSATDELDPLNPHDVGPGGTKFDTVTGISVTPIIATGSDGAQIPALAIQWDTIDDQTVTSLKLQYRKVGDSVAISENILEPAGGPTGVYAAYKGVQGNLQYEVRLQPVTLPKRPVNWSAWIPSDIDSPPQIVDVAAVANSVPPGTITPEMLSDQTRKELALATGLDDLQGSVNERIQTAIDMARQAASAAMGIAAQQTELLRAVRAQSEGNTIGITESLRAISDVNGVLSAAWTLSLDVNNNVRGAISLGGTAEEIDLFFLADKIAFCLPDGTGAKQIITVGVMADGSTGVGIDANNVIIAGTIKAEHLDIVSLDAITSNIGIITAGQLRNPAGTLIDDFVNMRRYRTDKKADLNLGDTNGGPYFVMQS